MDKYQMTVTLNSPVCIAKKKGVGNFIETFDYIPGSTIRGALALLYIKQNGIYNSSKGIWCIQDKQKKEEFEFVFNSDNTIFGNCHFKGAKVIPFTASSCKYHPGFYSHKRHGVLDTLIENAIYESSVKISENCKMPDKYDECKECKSVMDRFSGFYSQNGSYELSRPSRRLITHTSIMDSTETAMPGNLYTIEVLNELQDFIGIIKIDGTYDIINNLINQNNVIHIGKSKSRGLGEIEIYLQPNEPNEYDLSLSERLTKINESLEKLNQLFFSVTLYSDAILHDEILRCKSKMDTTDFVETLENLAKKPSPDEFNKFSHIIKTFHHHRDWLSTYTLSGWSIAWRLPKEDEIAISKGSVFLFCTDSNLSDEQKDNIVRMLSLIEQAGVGERRNEGFGKIRFCDEFHWKEELK